MLMLCAMWQLVERRRDWLLHRRSFMDNGEVFMKLMHLATQNQIAVKFVPFTVSYARLKGNPQGMRMGISQNLQTIEEVNYNLAHELAHAYLHYDKGDTINSGMHEQYEEQADRAAKMLLDAIGA